VQNTKIQLSSKKVRIDASTVVKKVTVWNLRPHR